jgi:hypothetical protein
MLHLLRIRTREKHVVAPTQAAQNQLKIVGTSYGVHPKRKKETMTVKARNGTALRGGGAEEM